ncbi:50S ribosomal protein L10 [Miniphocaeibacter massiliensis]|uniref:50S ribosomal protein L10 n=1 Tax=Miniphocaeibacter massiliensis TaxID=2041841 RepID=UPI000C1BCC70|nr:50S ribosomal protein L10 [Miniphocaeibacter massiliensis]
MKDYVLEKKQSVVNEIKENIESSKSMVLIDYRGLNVEELTDLRNRFRKENVVYKVYKNTMMNFAFKDLGLEEITELLVGPNAVAFSTEDPIAAARIANDFAKDHDKLEIKAGYLEGEYLDVTGVKDLASIPSREVLLAKLLGSFKAPVSNFVYLADAIAKKKAEESPAEEATVEETEAPEAE